MVPIGYKFSDGKIVRIETRFPGENTKAKTKGKKTRSGGEQTIRPEAMLR